MSKSGKRYSADFKAKVILELLEGELTMNQIGSKYGVTAKSLQAWKNTFLAHASLAFDVESVVCDYKKELEQKEKEVCELHRQLGKRTAELEWASKKLKSLDCEVKKDLVDSKLKTISVVSQCDILGLCRSSFYYKEVGLSENKIVLLRAIDEVYSAIPFYGYRKVYQVLLERGYSIGLNRVRDYMLELGLKTIYPTKAVRTTMINAEHKKYPYLLRDLKIRKANQVWSTDLTYIRLNGGFVYMAAIIDWYSKTVLAYKISNTMDSALVISVLQEAISRHGAPEIFNTDQGSQYTSVAHTELLIQHGIKISMDGKGRATDNIAIERFWRSAKYENIYLSEYKTIKELRLGIAEYIRFYNEERFHQTLHYLKPMNVYKQSIAEQSLLAA